MAREEPSGIAAELKARGPGRRSDLYRWLLSHYEELAPLLNLPAPAWVDVAALIAGKGVLGANGAPASPKALRQLWLRVSRDVEAERARKAAAKHVRLQENRSHSEAGRQPQAQRSSPPAGSNHRLAAPPPEMNGPDEESVGQDASPPAKQESADHSGPMTIDDLSSQARARVERVRKELAEADRKRFGNL